MLKQKYKCSTAEGPGPRETNLEATASQPHRHRVRQLKLTTSLLNRLVNLPDDCKSTSTSLNLPTSKIKLIDISAHIDDLLPQSSILAGNKTKRTITR
jgi:hypothetical protein